MHLRTTSRRRTASLVGAAAIVLAASPVLAGESRPPVPVPAPAALPILAPLAPAPAPIVCGLVAFLDPDTGLLTGPISWLTPPADQAAAAATVLLEEVPMPDGGWMIDLQGTLMESYVLHLDAFGRATAQCVPAAQATAIVAGKGR